MSEPYSTNGAATDYADLTDNEMERRFLGASILQPSVAVVVAAVLEYRDFFREAHRTVYRAVSAVAAAGLWSEEEGGLSSVAKELREGDRLDAVGGFSFLAAQPADAEPLDNVAAAAEHLAALATRRRWVQDAGRIATLAYETPDRERLNGRIAAIVDHRLNRAEGPPRPTVAEVPSTELRMTSLREGLETPEPTTQWVVDGLLNQSGTSCLSGPFKGGKSTLLRILCVAASAGIPFLGRDTAPIRVGYISLEEDRAAVKDHFRLLAEQVGDDTILDRIHYVVGDEWLPHKMEEKIDLIHGVITDQDLQFLVLGPLQDFFAFRNINDYSEVKPALRAFTNKVARTSGCHVCFDHHNNKYGSGRAAFLGSVAIGGGVDQLLTLTVVEDDNGQVNGRGLTTWQRYGESILSLLGLDFVPNRLDTSLGPPPERLQDQAGLQQLAMKITALCHTWTEARVIEQEIGGNKERRIAATNWAVDQTMLARRPRKGRGGGYEYLDRTHLDDADDLGTGSGTSSDQEDR